MRQHAASLITHTEASTGAGPPSFIEDVFDASRRMSQTAAHLVDHVIPRVPVPQ